MVKEQMEELLQKALLGELSDLERQGLRELFEVWPQARERLRALDRLSGALLEIPEAEPPRELARTVMDRLPEMPARKAAGAWGAPIRMSAYVYSLGVIAFFYLVLGLTLWFRLPALEAGLVVPNWLKPQPAVALFAALAFVLQATLIHARPRATLRVIGLGLLVHILLSIGNNLLLSNATAGDLAIFPATLYMMIFPCVGLIPALMAFGEIRGKLDFTLGYNNRQQGEAQ